MSSPDAGTTAVILGAAAGVTGWLPPPRDVRLPAGGPTDLVVYVTLDLLLTADGGFVGSDGRVGVVDMAERRVTILDLEVIDRLKELHWIEYTDHETVRVTDRGRYWSDKFSRSSRLRTGRLWGEWSRSR